MTTTHNQPPTNKSTLSAPPAPFAACRRKAVREGTFRERAYDLTRDVECVILAVAAANAEGRCALRADLGPIQDDWATELAILFAHRDHLLGWLDVAGDRRGVVNGYFLSPFGAEVAHRRGVKSWPDDVALAEAATPSRARQLSLFGGAP